MHCAICPAPQKATRQCQPSDDHDVAVQAGKGPLTDGNQSEFAKSLHALAWTQVRVTIARLSALQLLGRQ